MYVYGKTLTSVFWVGEETYRIIFSSVEPLIDLSL